MQGLLITTGPGHRPRSQLSPCQCLTAAAVNAAGGVGATAGGGGGVQEDDKQVN